MFIIRLNHLALTGLMLFVGCGTDQSRQKSFLEHEGIEASFRQVFEENELMGMAVVIIYDCKTVWEGYFGLADSVRQMPVTDRTMYRVASISKMFAAAAILQLWEAGKVDLDTDVSDYLGWPIKHPEYMDVPITLRHLMSHQSGIRDCDAYYDFSDHMIHEKLNIQELFLPGGMYFSEELFAAFAPGDYFSYANCSWGLVATVVEKISGERFDNYCRKHILQPMGMHADFNVAEIESMENIAVLYRYKNGKWIAQADNYQGTRPESRAFGGYELGQNGLIFGPQGSLRSSASDLAIFACMLMNEGTWNGQRILKKETVDIMLAEQWAYDGNNGNTGDGFFLSYGLASHRTFTQDSSDVVFPDRKMTGHPGDAYGLLSGMYLDKTSKTGIVFISNGGKQITAKGKKTAFYRIEEDVYAAAYKYSKKLEMEFP